MAVEWNAHRFSGGALALSAANSVVMRHDAEKRFDRFDDPAELPRFAAAASVFCATELAGAVVAVSDPAKERTTVIAVREAVDRLFRSGASAGRLQSADLAGLLAASANALAGVAFDLPALDANPAGSRRPIPLASAMVLSALALLRPELTGRIKICPNCAWLFVDKSRNAARLWCDMAVCGNRAKARRHYRKSREHAAERSGTR